MRINIEPSLSMPQNWYPKDIDRNFRLDDPRRNRKKAYELFLYEKRGLIEEVDDAKLIANPKTLISHENGAIHEIGLVSKIGNLPMLHYYLNYKELDVDGIECVSQVLVYHSGRYPGITKHVFFDLLLTKYKSIIMDKQQSGDGRRFWENQIYYALGNGYYVYYVDLNHNVFEPVLTKEAFNLVRLNKEPWGDHIKYQKRRFMICTEPVHKLWNLDLWRKDLEASEDTI